MASESTDEAVSVSLPPELAEWVDKRATEHKTDRETVLVQVLTAHRAADQLGDSADVEPFTEFTNIEDEVRNVIAEQLSEIAGAVAGQLDIESQVQDVIDTRQSELTQAAANQATEQVNREVDALEDDFMTKVEDVRDRVIQVKKETDKKASAEHGHPDLVDRIDELADEVAHLADDIDEMQDEFDSTVDRQKERFEDLDETVWDMQEKLQTVAYVVRDLRDDNTIENKRATSVDSIKQAASKHDVDRAQCEACGTGVTIALMTDPECPHCESAVTDVKPSDGILSKPRLVKAQEIEAADTDEGV